MLNGLIGSLAWKGFLRRKGRYLISTFGFSLAVIIYVVILAILDHSAKSTSDVLIHTGTHFIAYKPYCCAPPFFDEESDEGFVANGAPSQPLPRELITQISRLRSVADASPFLLFRIHFHKSMMLIGGFDPENAMAVASTSCSASDLVSGRFLCAQDTDVVMLEQSFALLHNLKTGASLEIEGKSYQVIGIVNPGIRPAKADVYMVIRETESVLSRSASVPVQDIMNIILVESAGARVHRQAMEDVKNLIGSSGLISTYGCFKPASKVMILQDHVLRLLTILIFLFATFLALQTQLTSVNERKRDIGILCSMGWGRRAIGILIFYEAMIQALLGAVIGAFMALILTFLLLQKGAFVVPWSLLGAAIALTLVGGFIVGILPAWIFTRKLPIDNLGTI